MSLLLIGLLACRHAPPTTAPAELTGYPGELRPPATLAGDFLWRQRVTAHWLDRERGFDAVLQKQGDSLVLVGLTPVQTPAFVIRLDGDELGFEDHSALELPFPPRFVMLDVQRVFLPWLEGAPPEDGERSGAVDGELVWERWEDGRLVERSFRRLEGGPEGLVRVRYEYQGEGPAPSRAELDNGWFGYRLVIETVEQIALDPS